MHLKPKISLSIGILTTCWILFATTLNAKIVNTQDTIPIKDSLGLNQTIEQITISAFRIPFNRLNIPATVDYLPNELLNEGNAITPIDALNKIPGINMHHGTFNTNRLTIRGIGSRSPYATNKIKAYFGEIPLSTGDGETTLEDLETGGIDHVEIIKGPSSSLYGAGLGGTILFYPLNPLKNFANHESTVASFNTQKHVSSAAIKRGNSSIFALYSRLNSDGFRNNNETQRDNFMLNSKLSLGANSNISILMKLTKMKAFIPSSINQYTFENTPWKAAENWQNIKGYEDYTNAQIGASLNMAGKRFNSTVSIFAQFRDADELRPFNLLNEKTRSFGTRGNFQRIFKFNTYRFNISGGYEIFREKYLWETYSNDNSSMLSDNKEHRSYENIYIQGDFSRSTKMNVSLGLNYNNTRYTYTDLFLSNGDQSGEHKYTPVMSQRLGFNYKIQSEIALYSNMSYGFSPPSFEETLYPEGTINPDIQPEKGWNIEFGTRGNLGSAFTFNISYYRIYISDLLVARRTGDDAWVGVNAGKSEHPGLEAYMKMLLTRPGSYPSIMLSANSNIANYHFTDFTDEGVDYSGNLLPGTSRFSAYGSVIFAPFKTLDISVKYRHKGEMPVNDLNSEFSGAYGLTDIHAQFSATIRKLNLRLKAGVNNLFDINYASMIAVNATSFGGNAPRYYYPGNPINYFASVSIGL